ncbi:MAG: hypothetical protein PHC75_01525 [Burkholderiales bacterium]|nr:hypothetical protein [Burkholderiales bacterium]
MNTLSKIMLMASSAMLFACNSGGSGNSSNPTAGVYPYPYPAQGTYNGNLYTNLAQPSSVSSGILKNNYPSSYFPTQFGGTSNSVNNNPALQIAYGRNDESSVAKIVAFVFMNGNEICTATPVSYDANSDTTFLVGAAHCFVKNKTSATSMESVNLTISESTIVYNGVNSPFATEYTNANVYVRKDYCYNAVFGIGSSCPNFSPADGAANGQGNDIAVIQVTGEYGGPNNRNNYPSLAESHEYPTPYTMAPILSIGYGINTQQPYGRGCLPGGCGYMYYVAGYQYQASNSTGYHYLYSSYFNSTKIGNGYSYGYSDLICGGDSGGPDLFWTGSKWILLAEHTYGPSSSCGKFYKSLPNAATNVSAYYGWIQSIISAGGSAKANCRNGTIANCVTNN